MNFNHFGRRTDFGMLEMDIAPLLCQQLKKEISFNDHCYLKIVFKQKNRVILLDP